MAFIWMKHMEHPATGPQVSKDPKHDAYNYWNPSYRQMSMHTSVVLVCKPDVYKYRVSTIKYNSSPLCGFTRLDVSKSRLKFHIKMYKAACKYTVKYYIKVNSASKCVTEHWSNQI